MSYLKPFIDESGAHIPSYEDILEYLITKFKEIYGNDIYLEEDSQDYQFLSSLALMYYDCCQTFLLAYGNLSPTVAIGASLDRLCAINGIVRKSNSYSVAPMLLIGTPGISISYVQVADRNGYVWQLDSNITFDINGEALATAACLTPGAIQASTGTIDVIITPTFGWISATNTSSAVVGSDVEEDSDLRERRLESVAISSITPFDGLIAGIKSLPNVLRITGYENDTGNTVGVLPPHSIAIIAEGGTTQEIGEAIYLKKTPGVSTFGSISVEVESSLGLSNVVKFSRPTYIEAIVELTIQSLPGYAADILDVIKSNIVSYLNNLSIGESLYISNMYMPILSAITDSTAPGFYVKTLTVNSESEEVTAGMFDALICDISDITITVL